MADPSACVAAKYTTCRIKEQKVEKINLNKRAEFNTEFRPQILKVAANYKTPLICMNPGQEIPPHPSGTGVFYFISGKGVMTIDGVAHEVGAGDMVFVEKGESRGILALDPLTAFAVHITE